MHPLRLDLPLRAAALLAGALALGAAPAAAQDPAYEWQDQLRPGDVLRVYSVQGEVTTARAAGSTARVTGRGSPDRRGRFDIEFEARRVDDGVIVCALYRGVSACDDDGLEASYDGDSRGGRVHFVVEVPQGVNLRVSSGNGDVSVDGATADVHAASGNGEVRVGAGAARVTASSGNGDVTVDEARGAVRASSGNGPIRVATASGPVSASTGNGSIQVRMASVPDEGDMEFSSGNGSITLELPADFAAELSARTGHGRVDVDFPVRTEGRVTSTRLRGTIGDADRRLDVSTGNGSIRLRRR